MDNVKTQQGHIAATLLSRTMPNLLAALADVNENFSTWAGKSRKKLLAIQGKQKNKYLYLNSIRIRSVVSLLPSFHFPASTLQAVQSV